MSNCTKPLVSDLIDKAWQCIVSFGRAKKTTYMYKLEFPTLFGNYI